MIPNIPNYSQETFLYNQTFLQTDNISLVFEDLLSILKSHDFEPILPLIQNDSLNEFSFISAISEVNFSTTKHQDLVLNKCLKTLKVLLKQEVLLYHYFNILLILLQETSIRLSNLKTDHLLLDNFLTNPYNPEFTTIQIDLVSITYEIKVCLYTISKQNQSELDCCYFSNNNTKVVNILKLNPNTFLVLNDINYEVIKEQDQQLEKKDQEILELIDKVNIETSYLI